MSDLEGLSIEELIQEVRRLRTENLKEKQKRIIAEEQLQKLRESAAEAVKQVEAEEEFISNTLMKRLSQLKSEKEKLALQIEEEEEFLTNNLQMKLEKLKREKIEMENQMEQEQEYIVNKLQRQLDELRNEKYALEKRVEELSHSSSPNFTSSAVSQPHSPSMSSFRLSHGSENLTTARRSSSVNGGHV